MHGDLRHDLPALRAQAEDILRQLQALQNEAGIFLGQLETVDWSALAEQGKLAGFPKFLIQRAITDARHVLVTGEQDLTEILTLARGSDHDLQERLQALVRLYADTPDDIRNRCRRLTGWLSMIDEVLQQQRDAPLSAHISIPRI